MTVCYNFITLKLKEEEIQARPVKWDREIADGFGNDAQENPVKPTEFHATCPYCGNLVHFSVNDIYKDVYNNDNIKCPTCYTGNETGKSVALSQGEIFIDPINKGIFGLEVNKELLDKLDLAKSS